MSSGDESLDQPSNEETNELQQHLSVSKPLELLAENMDQTEQPEIFASESTVVISPPSSEAKDLSINPEKPHHPVLLSFPLRTFGKQRRSFCSSWYQKYPWLHYQEANDSVICFHCHVAERRHLPGVTLNRDDTFITAGFTNWKKAIEKFIKHEKTIAHRQAVELVEKIPKTTKDVGEMLSSAHAQLKAETVKC